MPPARPVPVDRICLALEHGSAHGGAGAAAADGLLQLTSAGASGCCGWRTAGSCAPRRSMRDIIRRAFEIRKPAKLSQPALEVLTIIAYYQPTTRAYVDQMRGVDSSYTVGLLLDRHLIEECGRLQVPGRPRLYRTTKAFLRAFHLNSLEDLPEMPGMEADGQLRLAEGRLRAG